MVKNIKLYNDDCFNVFPKIKDKSIDLFILDLPYGQTACKWDILIDLDKMWIEIKRTMKPSAVICFFCTTKFGYSIIKSNEKWFKYDLIWKKSRKVGFLSANKRQLRQHENIYVFKEEQGTYHPQKTEGKPYKTKEHNNAGYYYKDGNYKRTANDNKGDRHPTSIIEHENIYVFKEEQGTYHPQKTELKKPDKRNRQNDKEQKIVYGENVNLPNKSIYKDRHPTSIIEHENVYVFKKEQGTYNPQKTEGKPYKNGADKNPNNVYGITKEKGTIIKTDRHPTSIIEHKDLGEIEGGKPFKRMPPSKDGTLHPTSIIENTILEHNNPHKTIHRTEKPVSLLEYLIKTYSNEGDKIMDFTMGSASCGVACMNTNRKFIGVEMDKEIFKLANNRIKEHEKLLKK